MIISNVKTFKNVSFDKNQVLKVLEEAVEVHSAWEHMRRHPGSTTAKNDLLAECADVIQATLNLVAAMGVEDFRPYMKACERRNRERGRCRDAIYGNGFCSIQEIEVVLDD